MIVQIFITVDFNKYLEYRVFFKGAPNLCRAFQRFCAFGAHRFIFSCPIRSISAMAYKHPKKFLLALAVAALLAIASGKSCCSK